MKKIFTLALLAVFALVSCTPNSKDPVDPYPESCDKHDVDLILSEVGGAYFDAQYSEVPGSYNYNVILSTHKDVYDLYSGGVDFKPSSQHLSLDIFADAPSANYSLTFKAPNGVYTLDAENTTAAGTLGTEYTCLYLVDENNESEEVFFTAGSVTVTDALIDAMLIAEDGKTYHIQCPNNLVDNTQSWGLGAMPQSVTTLTGDLNVPFTGESEIYADPYGDYLVIGKNLWFLYVDDFDSGDEFYIWLLVDPAKASPAGTYTISGDLTKECALVGYPCAYTNSLTGSWWMHLDANYEPDAMAALVSGSVVLTEGEDGMGTVVVNAVDDLGHKVTGTCNAPLTVVEAGGWSLNKLSTGAKFAKHAKKQLAPRKVKISSLIKK